MKTRILQALLGAFLMVCCVGPVAAQDWAKTNLAKSPRHGEYVMLHEPNGRKVLAWVVYPEIKEKAPVVVMVHEIFGLSDWAREMADEIAGAGYIVVVPDLLSGLGPVTKAMLPGSLPPATLSPETSSALHASGEAAAPVYLSGTGCDPMDCAPGQVPLLARVAALQTAQQRAMNSMQRQGAPGAAFMPATPGGTSAFPDQSAVVKAVSALPDAQVLADLDAAAEYGKKLPAASGKLFVVGFCWGGGKSFLFATQRKNLSAAFVFYGPPPPAEAMKNITAPVYGFYAGNDARITVTIPQTEADMKAAGKKYEPVVYDGAGHGFMRLGEAPDANAANAAARAAGFRRLIALLGAAG